MSRCCTIKAQGLRMFVYTFWWYILTFRSNPYRPDKHLHVSQLSVSAPEVNLNLPTGLDYLYSTPQKILSRDAMSISLFEWSAFEVPTIYMTYRTTIFSICGEISLHHICTCNIYYIYMIISTCDLYMQQNYVDIQLIYIGF